MFLRRPQNLVLGSAKRFRTYCRQPFLDPTGKGYSSVRQHAGANFSEATYRHSFRSWALRVVFVTGNRDKLQVRAEGKQTAVAVLYYKFARLPRRVAKSARELYATSCILGVKRVRILEEHVSVEQFVRIFVGFAGFTPTSNVLYVQMP